PSPTSTSSSNPTPNPTPIPPPRSPATQAPPPPTRAVAPSRSTEPAHLTVHAWPYALVTIDGGPELEAPFDGRAVPPGRRTLRARNERGEDALTVTLEPGQRFTWTPRLGAAVAGDRR
ncbi:MAG TPA: hypothetical protein VFP65_08145, partial [Anaeromyxobacteraceae bacterium]|nr:hypothetical protein [Anaeromyxobacteraceae bacterium]